MNSWDDSEGQFAVSMEKVLIFSFSSPSDVLLSEICKNLQDASLLTSEPEQIGSSKVFTTQGGSVVLLDKEHPEVPTDAASCCVCLDTVIGSHYEALSCIPAPYLVITNGEDVCTDLSKIPQFIQPKVREFLIDSIQNSRKCFVVTEVLEENTITRESLTELCSSITKYISFDLSTVVDSAFTKLNL